MYFIGHTCHSYPRDMKSIWNLWKEDRNVIPDQMYLDVNDILNVLSEVFLCKDFYVLSKTLR